MDPLQWMGAVRIQTTVKKHQNNPQVIHTTWEAKSYMFVRNKYIIKMFSNCFVGLKYEFFIHIIAFSEKVILSEQGNCLQAKTVLNKYMSGF